jgi:hypothetical protein
MQMDIEEAFTTEAIEVTDTNVDDQLEIDLRDVIARIYSSNELDVPSEDTVNIAVLCFVAGRTYQYDLSGRATAQFNIPMTPDEVYSYISYLSQRGAR